MRKGVTSQYVCPAFRTYTHTHTHIHTQTHTYTHTYTHVPGEVRLVLLTLLAFPYAHEEVY